MPFPMDRAAADAVPHDDVGRTVAGGGDRIVLRASPIVGQQRVAAALERRLEIGTLGGEIARPQPVALLETQD